MLGPSSEDVAIPKIVGHLTVEFSDGTRAQVPTRTDRIFARTVDLAVILATAIFAQQTFWSNRPASLEARDFELLDQIASFVLFYSAAHLVYEILQHRLWGKTLGKFLMFIRLASSLDGGRVTCKQAIGRAMVVLPLGITMLRDPVYQGYHDYLANTIVIRGKSPPTKPVPG